MKNKRQTRENKAIQDAIAHLNGYATVVQASTGYKPIAVYETIEELRRMIK